MRDNRIISANDIKTQLITKADMQENMSYEQASSLYVVMTYGSAEMISDN